MRDTFHKYDEEIAIFLSKEHLFKRYICAEYDQEFNLIAPNELSKWTRKTYKIYFEILLF